jgi:oligoendopeptidase F
MNINKLKRQFIPNDFKITNWESLEPFFKSLLDAELNSATELEQWMRNRSELESIVSEDMAWRYIHMNCDTTNKKLSDEFEFFVTEIEPHIAPYSDKLNKKLVSNKFISELPKDKYAIYLRGIIRSIELFREENIPLFVEINKLQQEYGKAPKLIESLERSFDDFKWVRQLLVNFNIKNEIIAKL